MDKKYKNYLDLFNFLCRGESDRYFNLSTKSSSKSSIALVDQTNDYTENIKEFSQNSEEDDQFFIIDEEREEDQSAVNKEEPDKKPSINQSSLTHKPCRESHKKDILLYRPIKVT